MKSSLEKYLIGTCRDMGLTRISAKIQKTPSRKRRRSFPRYHSFGIPVRESTHKVNGMQPDFPNTRSISGNQLPSAVLSPSCAGLHQPGSLRDRDRRDTLSFIVVFLLFFIIAISNAQAQGLNRKISGRTSIIVFELINRSVYSNNKSKGNWERDLCRTKGA